MVAFIDVTVIPMDRERVLPHQTVIARDGHIVALGPVAAVSVPDGATRVDGRDKFLLPGLADMHAMLPLSFDWNLKGSQDGAVAASRLARARRVMLRYLAVGVTTVRLMQGPPVEMLALRAEAAHGAILSPRIYAAAVPFGSARLQGLTDSAVMQRVEAAKEAGFDLLDVYDADGAFGTVASALREKIVAAARGVKLPLAGHYSPNTIREGIESYGSLEHLVIDSSHAVDWSSRQQRGGRTGVWVTPTLVYVIERAEWMDQATAVQGLRALRRAGAGLLLGSAGWGSNPAAVVPRELAALVRAGLSPYEALETGTRNAAEYFSTQDSTGTVAVGKRADLVLLTKSPLHDIHAVTALAGVMLGGHWLPATTLAELVDLTAGIDRDIDAQP